MRIVRQKTAHGYEEFRLKVWKKKVYVRGWHAELKIGNRQWNLYPNPYRKRAYNSPVPKKENT